jgi:hypothetical protein
MVILENNDRQRKKERKKERDRHEDIPTVEQTDRQTTSGG